MIPRLDLATLHYNRGELDEARAILKDGLSGDFQRDRPLNFYLGNIALKQGHYLAAKAYYDSALDFQGASERAELADRLFQQEKKAREGAPKKEEDPRLLAEKARLLLDDTDRKEAKILARGEVPSDQDAAYLKLQRQDARKWLEQAAPRLGSDPGVLVDLGRARGAMGDVEGARDALETAARLAPSNGRPLFLLGEILRKKGRLTEALSCFQRALARGPISSASARTYLAIAEIQGSLGKPEQARQRQVQEGQRQGRPRRLGRAQGPLRPAPRDR
jgi:tetratricopeptide (TPR) repeat protein